MEYRKLIRFGKNSHVISLPKDWLAKHKLSKGDTIYLDESSEGLIIAPQEASNNKNEIREATIDISKKTISEIKREIIPAYLNNFHTIKIMGDDLKEKAVEIRHILRALMALEVVEQTSTKIVARDFLNIHQISITDMIRKMDLITREMVSDSKAMFKEDLSSNISHRDDDVNGLSNLAVKVIKYALREPGVARSIKTNPYNLLGYWRIVTYIENIADEAKRIAKFLKKTKLDNKQIKELVAIYSDIENLYLDTMKSYYKGDNPQMYRLARNKKPLLIKCDGFLENNLKDRWIPIIIEKLKNMVVLVHHIGIVRYA